MGISKRNPRGNFNWQSRILKKKAQCCGQLNEPFDCGALAPILQVSGTNICLTKPQGPVSITCTNTQPDQATDTLYEWYFKGSSVYSSYGPVSTFTILTPTSSVEGAWTVVATNIFGCVTTLDFNVYVSNSPDISIMQADATDPCNPDPGNPFGQSSNGIIGLTVNNPDPNALYYGYVIKQISSGIAYETTDPLDTFTWNDLCLGRYEIKVKLYRLIDGTPTVMCTYTHNVTLGALILTWDSIANVPVADPYNVAQWNTWLGYPASFTEVTIIANSVYLKKPTGNAVVITSPWSGNTHIVSIYDQVGWVIFIDNYAMQNCTSLVSVNIPDADYIGGATFKGCTALQEVISTLKGIKIIGDNAFEGCVSLDTLTFPGLNTGVGQQAIGVDQTNNNVFLNVIGATITVTVQTFFQTSNAGGLEGDLAYLNANNTVTFIWV